VIFILGGEAMLIAVSEGAAKEKGLMSDEEELL
jgi:hypothetical protein